MYAITTKTNTMFFSYEDKQDATEAQERLATIGDSIGMKWPKSQTKVIKIEYDNSKKGWHKV